MKNILTALHSAKKAIKGTQIKKSGRNAYSGYNYFTPEQIEELVYTACEENGLVTKFDLLRNELGIEGNLTIYHLESGESIVYRMASAIPDITATNMAQRLGGSVTYTERYLKMTAFGIAENDLDFDKTPEQAPVAPKQEEAKPWLNLVNKDGSYNDQYAKLKASIDGGQKYTLAAIQAKYSISKQSKEVLATLGIV